MGDITGLTVFEGVLIDTWWNVNQYNPLSRVICLFVLIDTWWNVNAVVVMYRTLFFIVLIDTWWNVNFLVYYIYIR